MKKWGGKRGQIQPETFNLDPETNDEARKPGQAHSSSCWLKVEPERVTGDKGCVKTLPPEFL